MKNQLKNVLSDSNLYELISKAGVYLVFRIFGFLFAYIFAIVVVKQYGSETYGFITLGFTFIVIGAVITRLGYDVRLTRLFSSTNVNRQDSVGIYFKSISISIIVSFLLSFLIYQYSEEIATKFFKNESLAEYLKWAAFSIPFWSIVMINTGVLRGFKKNNLFSFFNTFGRFLFSIIFLLLFVKFHEKNGEYAIIAHFLGLALLAVLSFVYVVKAFDKITFATSIKIKEFSASSFPILVAALVIILLDWSDKIFLGVYEEESLVGIYDITFRIAILIKFTLEAINSILAPKISQMYSQKDMNQLQKTISFSTKINTFISIILFLGLVLFAEDLLRLIGEEFVQGKTALIILALGQLIGSLSGSVGIILQMTENQKVFQNIALITLLINVILNIILIPAYSVIGAAIATAISLCILNISCAVYIKVKLNLISFFSIFKA